MNKFGLDHLPAFICNHIFENTKPILLVCHNADGDWQFLCGGTHAFGEKPKVVGIVHLLERDPTLKNLVDMPVDYEAERESIGSKWIITKIPTEEEY
jgi:hypothetical protein